MKLYMSDLYRVEVHYPLDEVSQDILYYLYQPLIGSNALNVYMMLYTEGKRMSRFLQPSSLSRMMTYTSYSLLDLQKYIQSLEAIGLLKTYVKNNKELTYYIFVIQSPLSIQSFFNNQILSSLFQESLSEDDLNKTMQYFKASVEDKSGFEDITSSFTDVFSIVTHKQKRVLKHNDFKEKQHEDIDVSYDYDALKKYLMDYQVPMSLLSSDDFKYIGQLGMTYSIDPLTLASLVKDATTTKQFDKKLFKTKVKQYCDIHSMASFKEIYHKQPLQYHTQSLNQDALSLHMQYLDTITPYELLKEKQGGSEPVIHDLSIVETLMVQLGLKPAVVNVLIEYVLGKNDNRLSKRYCEAIGASWARKNILTAMDAYHELMNAKEEKVEEHQEKDNVSESLEMDEIEQLLSEFKKKS